MCIHSSLTCLGKDPESQPGLLFPSERLRVFVKNSLHSPLSPSQYNSRPESRSKKCGLRTTCAFLATPLAFISSFPGKKKKKKGVFEWLEINNNNKKIKLCLVPSVPRTSQWI